MYKYLYMESVKQMIREEAHKTGLLAQSVGDQATHWLLTLNSGGTTAVLAAIFVTQGIPEASWLKTILISFLIGTIASLSSIVLRYSILDGMTRVWTKALKAVDTNPLDPSASPDIFFNAIDSFVGRVKYIYILCTVGFFAICFSITYGIYMILNLSL